MPQSVEFLIAIMISGSNILAQVLYQDQSKVQLIRDVTCPNRKCRGEKCVYLTSFEEINKNTYQCKQCRACSHVLKNPFKDQKPCVTLFGWTYCFRKKTKPDFQKEKLSPLMRQCISQSILSSTKADAANNELVQKEQRYYQIWNNRVTLLLSVLLQHKITFLSIFQTFLQVQHALLQSTQYNLQCPTREKSGFWTLVLIQEF